MGKAILLVVLLVSPQGPPIVGVMGIVKSVSEDGTSINMRSRAGDVRVAISRSTDVLKFNGEPFHKLKAGAHIQVLATRHSDPYYGGKRIINVTAVVSGEFDPPAFHGKGSQSKLGWISGTLSWVKGAPMLSRTRLNVSPKRIVTVAEAGKAVDIKRRHMVYVTGDLKGKKKSRTMDARKLVVISKRVPAKERSILLPQGEILGK